MKPPAINWLQLVNVKNTFICKILHNTFLTFFELKQVISEKNRVKIVHYNQVFKKLRVTILPIGTRLKPLFKGF